MPREMALILLFFGLASELDLVVRELIDIFIEFCDGLPFDCIEICGSRV